MLFCVLHSSPFRKLRKKQLIRSNRPSDSSVGDSGSPIMGRAIKPKLLRLVALAGPMATGARFRWSVRNSCRLETKTRSLTSVSYWFSCTAFDLFQAFGIENTEYEGRMAIIPRSVDFSMRTTISMLDESFNFVVQSRFRRQTIAGAGRIS